jgi:hypothetical protein
MATEQALRKLKAAEEEMNAAQEALRAFIDNTNRDFSADTRAKHKALLARLQESMTNYWEAFEEAANS